MSNDKAAATYGQIVAPHEFHWNSDVPGPGTCTCGRSLSHPLHLQAETTGDHTQTKLDDNPYLYGKPAMWVKTRGSGSLVPPDDSEFFTEPYDYEKAEGLDEYANGYMRTLGRPAHKAKRGWHATKQQLAIAASIALAIITVAGWMFQILG